MVDVCICVCICVWVVTGVLIGVGNEFFMSRLRVAGEETVVIVLFPPCKFVIATL